MEQLSSFTSMAFNLFIAKVFPAVAILLSVTAKQTLAQTSGDTSIVLFYETNQYKLTSSQQTDVSNFLHATETVTQIHGYADTVGSITYNRQLALLRSQQVFDFITGFIDLTIAPLTSGEEFDHDPDLSKNRKVVMSGNRRKNVEDDSLHTVDTFIDSFDVSNINFVADQAVLTPESLLAIPSLISRLKRYPDASFEVIGHVNYQSKRDQQFLKDLFVLSTKRAELVTQILTENGIPQNRLSHKGVGNTQPLIRDPKTNDERRKNMRVQIKVFSRKKI